MRIKVHSDVICIDQTRVVLKSGDGCSDFIHASRIPLGDNPNEVHQFFQSFMSDM